MSGRNTALTLVVLVLLALASAFVLTRAVACVALPVSEQAAGEPLSGPAPPSRAEGEPGARDAGEGRLADAGAVAEPSGAEPARRRRARRGRPAAPEREDGADPAPRGPRVVAREEVERVIADPSELRGARVALHEVDGEPVGLRLSGIGGGGPLARIGLRNGDVLLSVNGITVHDADGAIDAVTRLRAASDFRVRILRGGSPRVLRYRIE